MLWIVGLNYYIKSDLFHIFLSQQVIKLKAFIILKMLVLFIVCTIHIFFVRLKTTLRPFQGFKIYKMWNSKPIFQWVVYISIWHEPSPYNPFSLKALPLIFSFYLYVLLEVYTLVVASCYGCCKFFSNTNLL